MKELMLNKELYSLSSLNKAIQDYSHLADLKLSQDETYYIVRFENCRYDEKRTLSEFENYLIGTGNRNRDYY